MRFTTVQPIIQVAELSTISDLEWMLKNLTSRTLFHTVRIKEGPFSNKFEQYDASSSLSVTGDTLCSTDYESGYGNSVSKIEHLVAMVGNTIAWNQNGVVYVLNLNRNQRFTSDMTDLIPAELLTNIIVELPGK